MLSSAALALGLLLSAAPFHGPGMGPPRGAGAATPPAGRTAEDPQDTESSETGPATQADGLSLPAGLPAGAPAGADVEQGDPEGSPRRVESPVTVRRDSFADEPRTGVLEVGGRCRTDYAIEARIDRIDVDGAERYTLDGSETLTWTNATADTVDDLWFHLYLNAFANNRTTHLTAARGRLRGHLMQDGWGWSEIDAVRLVRADGSREDLTPTLTWEQPTDGNTDDRTVFRVELPEAVGPGATLAVEVEWTSRLPRVRRRTGTKDDFMLVSQWFPKLGVYEEDRGWNCWQFHAFSEWYADFGTYDVTLDLPAEFADRVRATGAESLEVPRGDRVEVSFAAPSMADRERSDRSTGREVLVHDFMWTADPGYYTKTKTFRFDEWADRFPEELERARRAFGDDFDPALREVTVEALIQPEREVQADRHIEATEAALFFYGLWFGEYPFERLTVVDPAWGARAAGGMEYPTIFTAGTSLFTQPWMHSPESVTVHEAGHQWFYLLSGNNEFESAWLDEGLNSYADSEVIARVWGDRRDTTRYAGIPLRGVRLLSVGRGGNGDALALRRVDVPPLDWIGLGDFAPLRPVRSSGFVNWWRDQPLLTAAPREGDPRWNDRGGYLSSPDRDPIDNWAWKSMSRGSHYTNTYSRTATVLRSMPAFLSAASGADGDAAFLRGMRSFAETWRFRHPYPDDFFNAFEEGDGLDLELDGFFDDLFRGTGTIDWGIEVSQRREPEAIGAFMGADGRFVLLDEAADEAGGEDPDGPPVAGAAGEAAEAGADGASAGADGGAPTEGAPTEGAPTEGAPTNGTPTNGTPTNGTPTNGAPADGPEREWIVEVTVKRDGSLALPVPIRLIFEDGAEVEYLWTAEEQEQARWITLTYASGSKLASAAVDPDCGYYIDTNRSNNAWYAERDRVAPLRWAERVFGQAAHTLHWYKGLGG